MPELFLAGESRYRSLAEQIFAAAGWQVRSRADAGTMPAMAQAAVLLSGFVTDPFLEEDEQALARLRQVRDGGTIFLLLDEEREAGPRLTSLALRRALWLAEQSRAVRLADRKGRVQGWQIAVAAKSMRIGFAGGEALYRQARLAGVTFVKYDEVAVDEQADGMVLTFWAAGIDYRFSVDLLVSCQAAWQPQTAALAQAWGLREDRSTGGRWFQLAGMTSRRNVWLLDELLLTTDDQAAQVLARAANALQSLPQPGQAQVAVVEAAQCAFCYSCMRACPHGAPVAAVGERRMTIDVTLCSGCGLCAALCPGGAISLRDQGGEREAALPSRGERLLLLVCENAAAQMAMELAEQKEQLELVLLHCGGELNQKLLTEALAAHDRVLVAICNRQACRHYDGNRRVCATAKLLQEEFSLLGVERQRLQVIELAQAASLPLAAAVAAALREQTQGEEEVQL